MSTVPHVSRSHYHPAYYFDSSCAAVELDGAFDMTPYQLVVVAGVLIYLHTLVTSLYYLLPVDDQNQKYIPGLKRFVETCLGNERDASEFLDSLYNSFRPVARLLEFLADLCLVVLSVVTFVLAAATLEAPYHFDTFQGPAYYSLSSMYLTFTAQKCISYEDPIAKLRASLAMFFFALCVVTLCLQVSWQALQKEVTHRAAPSGTAGGSDIARRGIHMEEGREAFMAQRLPTSSDHDDRSEGGESDGDEEVAVTFNPAPSSLRSTAENSADRHMQNRVAAAESAGRPQQQRDAYGTGGVRGAARGAALMRRYEGNSRTPAPPAREVADVESGGEREAEFADLPSGSEKGTAGGSGNTAPDSSAVEHEYEEADL